MKKGFTPASFVLFRSGYTLRKNLVRLKNHHIVGKADMEQVFTLRKLIPSKVLLLKSLIKSITSLIVTVSVSTTL